MGAEWGCSRALVLQGPTGPFFAWLLEELRSQGIRAYKVTLSVADELFFRGDDTIPFRGTPEEWPAFLAKALDDLKIEAVFLFGDLRPIHRPVVPLCRARGIKVWVFEEGYLRPDYVTVEEGGVNGSSSMPRDPEVFRRALREYPEEPPVESVRVGFGPMAWYSTISALAVTHLNQRYPHYAHHRNFNAWDQTAWWVRGYFRKHWFGFRERHERALYEGALSKKFYFVPLQVHCDFQVVHSPFESIPEFAEHAIREFAMHSAPDLHLVVKHHPMDRAYCDYSELMRDLATKYGLGTRLHYVHDVDLGTILKHAIGTIAMNSTVGIQSIEVGTPIKVLGNAIYDVPGMTFQGPLDAFLKDPGPKPDHDLYLGFRRYLRFHSQGNGNIWKRLRSVPKGAGVVWPAALARKVDARARSTAEQATDS